MFDQKQEKRSQPEPTKGTARAVPCTPAPVAQEAISAEGTRHDSGDILRGASSNKSKTPKLHHVNEKDATALVEELTHRQLRYCLARLLDPSWSNATCSRIAGYSKKSIQQTASRNERSSHIARILSAGRLNRDNRAEITDIEALDRENAINLLSRFANDGEYPAKIRMDAIKALRELEAWDKQTGNAHGINFLTVIMEQIDGRGVLPSRAEPVQIGNFDLEHTPSQGVPPSDLAEIEVEALPADAPEPPTPLPVPRGPRRAGA